jgi:hypothetical protein
MDTLQDHTITLIIANQLCLFAGSIYLLFREAKGRTFELKFTNLGDKDEFVSCVRRVIECKSEVEIPVAIIAFSCKQVDIHCANFT